MNTLLLIIPILIALAAVVYWKRGGSVLAGNFWLRALTMVLLVAVAFIIGLQVHRLK